MGNEIYENVKASLIKNGVHEDMAGLFLNKGLKDLQLDANTIDEKAMGIILQKHVAGAILMFFDENAVQKIIHNVTMDL